MHNLPSKTELTENLELLPDGRIVAYVWSLKTRTYQPEPIQASVLSYLDSSIGFAPGVTLRSLFELVSNNNTQLLDFCFTDSLVEALVLKYQALKDTPLKTVEATDSACIEYLDLHRNLSKNPDVHEFRSRPCLTGRGTEQVDGEGITLDIGTVPLEDILDLPLRLTTRFTKESKFGGSRTTSGQVPFSLRNVLDGVFWRLSPRYPLPQKAENEGKAENALEEGKRIEAVSPEIPAEDLELQPGGMLVAYRWDPEKRVHTAEEVGVDIFRQLDKTIIAGEGTTLRSLFELLDRNDVDLLDFCFTDCFIAPFVEQYRLLKGAPATLVDPADRERIEHLTLYWDLAKNLVSKEFTGWRRPNLGSRGIEQPDDYYEEGLLVAHKGERIDWSISFQTLENLLDLPLKLISLTPVYEATGVRVSNTTLDELSLSFTLRNVIEGVFWELSFYGTPDETSQAKETVFGAMEEVTAQRTCNQKEDLT